MDDARNTFSKSSSKWFQEFQNFRGLAYVTLKRYPFYDWYYHDFLKRYIFLKTSQWWSLKKLKEYQLKNLKRLLKYVYVNVPYYKQMFKKEGIKPNKITCLEDLDMIPLLDKETVINNFKLFINRNVKTCRIRSITSGTTGTRLPVAYGGRFKRFLNACIVRREAYNNSKFYQKKVFFGGAQTSVLTQGKNYLWEYDLSKRTLYFSASNLSDDILKIYVDQIRLHKPVFMRGNASAAYRLALYLKENSINDISFNSFTNRSEMLFDFQKDIIKEQFKCDVYNYYSQKEEVCSAMDCSCHKGLHIDMEKGIVEIVKDEANKKGKIVATCLHNYTMPLIRYETGDIGKVSENDCPCGRGLQLLTELQGRKDDTIILNNRVIAPLELSIIARSVNHIKECQFVQEDKNIILIRVVKREGYTNKDNKKLLKLSHKLMGEDVKINIKLEKDIERTDGEKFQFVISKLRS